MTPRERNEMTKMALLTANEIREKVDPSPPMDMLAAIMSIESNFNPHVVNNSPNARRRGGAWGIGQITLDTARDYAQRFPEEGKVLWPQFDGTGESLKNMATNIGFMVKHLSHSLKKFDGDWYKAAVAYHQGNGGVMKKVKEHGEQWAQYLPQLGKRYYHLLVQKRQAFNKAQAGETAGVATGPLHDGTGSGGGGGGDTPRPPADVPPHKC